MNKLLTIAIPTYNRAALLDKQLAWLAKSIQGFESECEIIVSDNCSEDNTQEIINKWQVQLNNTVFLNNRNRENIGLMPNIAFCIKSASGQYIWTVGDDDPIQEKAVAYLVTTLKQHPNLTLMFLNCSGRDKRTNKIIVEHWFKSNTNEPVTNGRNVFQRYLQESFGGVLFMTAVVYKTELVQRALKTWPTSAKNLASQAYWTGFCALHGSVIVTKDNYLECTMHASHLDQDPRLALMMQYIYIPEVYLKLLTIGYSYKFCQRKILRNLVKLNYWRIFLGGFRRWPFLAMRVMVYYLALICQSAYRLIFVSRKNNDVEPQLITSLSEEG
ncbi:glycosyltransferase family A protein [Anabaena cylindrica UHCC 0172]|uniref:glycosyltransferase family 2 protein n=1 Tax=Anabaena cylindrica TaxID=1165 RepID=UPI002B201E6D|nr:glycosyltransferase family A protein [Anabaena cylindrica]MEA5550914.1 glycosyltransferase family A protein [Anabaena cylindrica UHCC 0172]